MVDHARGSSGSNSITIVLLNGDTLTLTGSTTSSNFTVTDTQGDSCQGTAATVLNATCTLVVLGGIQVNLLGVLENSAVAGNLTMYCGIDTVLLSTSMSGSIMLGIAGSQAFVISVAAGSNAQTLYTGSAGNGSVSLTSVGSGTSTSIQGTYTAATATGTIAGPNVSGVFASWGATSPCALVPARVAPSSLTFNATASGPAPTAQSVVMTPVAVGPVSAIVGPSAPWLTATPSSDSISFTVSTNLVPGSYQATVLVYGQFAEGGPITMSVIYNVHPVGAAAFTGLFLASSDGQLMGYSANELATSNATPAINGTSAAASGAGYIAADSLGNLWLSSGVRGTIYEIPTSQFSSSGLQWSHSCLLPTPSGGNAPQPAGIAVGPGGTVWVADSANAGRFYGYTPVDVSNSCPAQANSPSQPSNTYHLTSITGSQVSVANAQLTGMAFDASGNLFIADQQSGFVYKILAGQLTGSNLALSADAALNVIAVEGDQSPHALAFDGQGNLWVSYLGQGSIAEFSASQLTASGASYPTPQNILTVTGVRDSVTSIAFDGTGNLWLVEAAHADANTGLAFVPANQLSIQNAILVPSVTFAESGAGPQLPLAIAFSPPPVGLPFAQRVRARPRGPRSLSR